MNDEKSPFPARTATQDSKAQPRAKRCGASSAEKSQIARYPLWVRLCLNRPPGLPSQTKTASPRPVGWVGLPKSLRFFSYCWRFYAATHTSLPWFFRMMFGNVFIPAWSFSKPRIAIQSLLGGFVLTAMLASSPVIAQVDDEAQKTVGSDSPEIAKPINSHSTVKNQVVIAEGVGATAEDAIKDAFRHAVRQVVGAVVDAETLIENDEIIEDKVLTYSDGFIKSYEEVVGSKKVKDGLHRIKIKAQVERGSVLPSSMQPTCQSRRLMARDCLLKP